MKLSQLICKKKSSFRQEDLTKSKIFGVLVDKKPMSFDDVFLDAFNNGFNGGMVEMLSALYSLQDEGLVLQMDNLWSAI